MFGSSAAAAGGEAEASAPTPNLASSAAAAGGEAEANAPTPNLSGVLPGGETVASAEALAGVLPEGEAENPNFVVFEFVNVSELSN